MNKCIILWSMSRDKQYSMNTPAANTVTNDVNTLKKLLS